MTPSERAIIWNKEHFEISRLYNIFTSLRVRANKKNLEFNIDMKWFKEKVFEYGKCEDTGILFDHTPPTDKYKRNPFSPSIDRRDPKKGYTKDNCKVVVWIHNRAKGDDDIGTLYYYCKELVAAIEGR